MSVPRPSLWDEFKTAPLFPLAASFTAGVILDRYTGLTTAAWLGFTTAALVYCAWRLWSGFSAPVAVVVFFVGAAHHHHLREDRPAHDISWVLSESPELLYLRGHLAEEPVPLSSHAGDPWEPIRRSDRWRLTLDLTAYKSGGEWFPATGRVRVSMERDANQDLTEQIEIGDELETLGLAWAPRGPRNPGERDQRVLYHDQGLRGEVHIDGRDGVKLVRRASRTAGVVAGIRRWASGVVRERLRADSVGPALALLLGDGSALERSEWEAYIRTGVVHTLVISGQHLAILAGFVWWLLRGSPLIPRERAMLVLLLIVAYTVLTGLRPSSIRACLMVGCLCLGQISRRPIPVANSFCLAWLVVLLYHPMDAFSLGCQLSFLSVFVLVFGFGRYWQRTATPWDAWLDGSRSQLEVAWRWLLQVTWQAFVVNAALTLVNLPLVLHNQNLVSLVSLLLGPVVVLLTTIALILGFTLFLVSPLPLLPGLLAWPLEMCFRACNRIVGWGQELPSGVWYSPAPATWWVVGFYIVLVAWLMFADRLRGWGLAALLGWIVLGIASHSLPRERAFVLAFLAVDQGGCIVIETPDGRCLIYDVGTTSGPQAVRRVVAPYLWSRGIRQVDEVFISHADSDHFNGLAELARRFRIGQISLTPSFAEKPTREVVAALELLKSTGIPSRVVVQGDRLEAGGLSMEVLHPPWSGPAGGENERSLVMLIQVAGRRILLTGDLEKAGRPAVLQQAIQPVDVLMAPHHGSLGANPAALVNWAKPKLVVVCRGPAQGNTVKPEQLSVTTRDTFQSGAIIFTLTPLTAHCHATGEMIPVK
ncbi:MAG: DNA internalization-related competence protein ComEC/Rec2 [Fimbriiglobus sp.]